MVSRLPIPPAGTDPASVNGHRSRWSGRPPTDDAEIAGQLRAAVAAQLAEHYRPGASATEPREDLGRRLIRDALDAHARAALAAGQPVLRSGTEARIERAVFDSLFALAGLQPLLDDQRIENINANGADRVFVRYADGTRQQVGPVAASDDELVELIRTMAARSGTEERRFDRGAPELNLDLPDGSRLFAVMAVSGRPCISIRRHRYQRITLPGLVKLGAIDDVLAAQLAALVRARKNILIAGGVASGKTTLLRALATQIAPGERLVSIEDTLELRLDADPGHPDTVALQARAANIEGQGAIDQAELVRWALRMSPDRVIVGEVRGAELIPMLNAMSQGNDGSLSTIHSSTSAGVFTRLAAYAAQAPERLSMEATTVLVASAVHVVVHLGWDSDGRRVVASVREVVDADGSQVISNEVYRPGRDGRAEPGVPWRTETMDELVGAGFDPYLLQRPGRWAL